MELAYRTTIALGRAALRAVDLRVRLEGAGNVPRTGPAILVADHVSFLDFLLVGLAARPAGRYPRFLARHEVWHHPVARPFMTAMRHLPVDRTAPAAAYLRARSLLHAGECPWYPAHLGGSAPTPQEARGIERTRHPHAVPVTWLPSPDRPASGSA